MKRKIKKSLIAISLCFLSLFGANSQTVFANSAQTHFEGIDSTGAIITDAESPIIVEKEVLTFDVQSLMPTYFSTAEEYFAYDAKVTAEYTFYNPSEITGTAKLLFPFGNKPHQADYYYDHEKGETVMIDDTEKYEITVNGNPIEKKVRHTLTGGGQFELEQDLSLICDGFAPDDFYSPDLLVTRYYFQISGVDMQKNKAACVAFDSPKGDSDHRIYMPDQSSSHLQKDGEIRIGAWVQDNGWKFEIYVFGNAIRNMPNWKLYKDGGLEDGEEISGKVELLKDGTTTMTFKEFALSNREEGEPVSDSDWYNAILAAIKSNEKLSAYSIASLNGYRYNFKSHLMRWYEYEIVFKPHERIVNRVIAPLYPSINLGYEPAIYGYTYLLSPAKTWKSFGPLEIVINTPYIMTQSSLKGFEKTESGYKLNLSGLPDGELEFTLSTSENPVKKISPYKGAFDFIIGVIVSIALLICGIIITVIIIKKNKKAKK